MPSSGMIQMIEISPTTIGTQRGALPIIRAPAVRWMMAGIETISTATSSTSVAAAP